MTLEEFKKKYPKLKDDLESLSDIDRGKLDIRICSCGSMNEQWCCYDPIED